MYLRSQDVVTLSQQSELQNTFHLVADTKAQQPRFQVVSRDLEATGAHYWKLETPTTNNLSAYGRVYFLKAHDGSYLSEKENRLVLTRDETQKAAFGFDWIDATTMRLRNSTGNTCQFDTHGLLEELSMAPPELIPGFRPEIAFHVALEGSLSNTDVKKAEEMVDAVYSAWNQVPQKQQTRLLSNNTDTLKSGGSTAGGISTGRSQTIAMATCCAFFLGVPFLLLAVGAISYWIQTAKPASSSSSPDSAANAESNTPAPAEGVQPMPGTVENVPILASSSSSSSSSSSASARVAGGSSRSTAHWTTFPIRSGSGIIH